jgi:hypothetical protein
MKKIFYSLFAAFIMTTLSALPIFGTGTQISRHYQNKGFTALSIASGMQLEVKQGKQYEVVVRTEESQLKLVKVVQVGDMLKFSLPPFSFATNPIEIFITMPELTEVDLSGGSTANITMNVLKTFIASLSGGAELSGALHTKQLELDLSGGSESSLTGAANTLKIVASGGSRILQESFKVNQAKVSLSGGCRAEVFVTESMDVDASGGAQVHYRGNPRLNTSFSGSAGINHL